MSAVPWEKYGVCPVCNVARGVPCMALQRNGLAVVDADRPHAGRRRLARVS